jgi:hypothetical protein
MRTVTAEDSPSSRTAPGGEAEHATTVLLLASGGFFLTTLDILIVNVTLTRMGQDPGGGTGALQAA